MLMVGSLMYFLASVCYAGRYDTRVYWILACYTVAIVLITRISMEDGQDRAAVFGLALAMAVALAVMRFSNAWFPLWILLGVVWWSAHKLTWDCTLIDEDQDSSGQGLLQLVPIPEEDTRRGQAFAGRSRNGVPGTERVPARRRDGTRERNASRVASAARAEGQDARPRRLDRLLLVGRSAAVRAGATLHPRGQPAGPSLGPSSCSASTWPVVWACW